MSLLDLLDALAPHHILAIVIGGSIVLYTLAANLAWLNRVPRAGRYGRLVLWAKTAWLARALGELARWVYYLALPYAALLFGYTTMRALGVWGMDWLASVPTFALLSVGAALVMVWVWRPYARAEHPHAIDESGWNRAQHIVEIIYQEAHWAFYRSGPILWLGDFYWGSIFGLVLTFIEGWSNPFVRVNVRDITRADAPLWSGGLAVVSTLVFLFTQNAWYCLVLHLALDVGLRGTIGFPRAFTPSD